jgi:hypothetical protein
MSAVQLDLLFGWAALMSAVATVATTITGILFFTIGGCWGKINDAVSVLQMVLMIPVAIALYLLRPGNATGLALLALAIGVCGMVVAAVLQSCLVFGVVEYEQTIAAVLLAGGAVGLWLILANGLALSARALPGGLLLAGTAAGMGYLLLAVGFHRGGQQHPLFYAGSLLAVVGYAIWGTWLGYLWLTGSLGRSTLFLGQAVLMRR